MNVGCGAVCMEPGSVPPDLGGSVTSGESIPELSVAIANVANRLPEYVETYPYYDVTQADWRGRYASVRLSLNW